MSKIKNSGLHQYGAEPLEQQQFETAGVEGVNCSFSLLLLYKCTYVNEFKDLYTYKHWRFFHLLHNCAEITALCLTTSYMLVVTI